MFLKSAISFKLKHIVSFVLLVGFAGYLSGCSLEANIERMYDDVSEAFRAPSGKEIVSVSQQGTVTAGGYSVQSSTSFHSNNGTVRTAQGYTVQTSVQSVILKK